jgi:HD superfamily phosphohydrolase
VPSELEIRDPIHGFIFREPSEQGIIDTRIFQRLRRLRQLAFAYLVYPGAVHTRFDHSLGAFHVACRMAKQLQLDPEERRLVRLAALLHDIGHGPFSHVSEPILERHCNKEKVKLAPKQQVHELITSQILRTDKELAQWILEKDREKVIAILEGKSGYSVLHDVVSGPLDADKQDYLLRDSHFCGVKYGVYDIDFLVSSLRLHSDAEDKYLAISANGIHALEQFVIAKYYMKTQVYHHRIRLITDKMVERAISLGIEKDNVPWLRDLYGYDGSPEHLEDYIAWNDDRLMIKVLEQPGETRVKSIFQRLVDRKLLKCILDIDEKDLADAAARMMVFAESDKFHKTLEDMIADRFKIGEDDLVICKLVSFPSAVKTESEILVLEPARKPTRFHEESVLFGAVNQAILEQRFHVYAPVTYTDERDRNRRRREFREEILEMIGKLSAQQTLSESKPDANKN